MKCENYREGEISLASPLLHNYRDALDIVYENIFGNTYSIDKKSLMGIQGKVLFELTKYWGYPITNEQVNGHIKRVYSGLFEIVSKEYFGETIIPKSVQDISINLLRKENGNT